MDGEIIKRWRAIVKPEDTVYILGDFSLKSGDYIHWYRSTLEKLPGSKHLILGNHDSLKPFTYIEVGFTSVHTHIELNGRILVHDPAVSVMDRSKVFLVGHVHDLFKVCKNAVNVGVDVWSFAPVSEQEINDIIEKEVTYG